MADIKDRLTVRLSDEEKNRLNEICSKEGCNPSDAVRQVINDYGEVKTVEVLREVVREVPREVVRTVEKEVIREVPGPEVVREVPGPERVVVKEVPGPEVIKTVVKEVPVIKTIEKIIEKNLTAQQRKSIEKETSDRTSDRWRKGLFGAGIAAFWLACLYRNNKEESGVEVEATPTVINTSPMAGPFTAPRLRRL